MAESPEALVQEILDVLPDQRLRVEIAGALHALISACDSGDVTLQEVEGDLRDLLYTTLGRDPELKDVIEGYVQRFKRLCSALLARRRIYRRLMKKMRGEEAGGGLPF